MTSWKAWFARTHSVTRPARGLRQAAAAAKLVGEAAKRSSIASSSSISAWVDPRRSDLRRKALELRADQERLAQLRAGQRAHTDAAVGLERDEPERRQAPKRLADRRPADAVPSREAVLAQHRPGGELTRDDRLLQLEGDVVGLRARRLAHRAVQPRSITTGAPVKARPPGPSRKAAVSATSSGSSIRLTACGASSTSSSTRSARDSRGCRLGLELRLDDRGPHVARADRRGGDPALGALEREHLDEAEQPVLRRDVAGLEGGRDEAVHGCDRQEATVPEAPSASQA